MSRSDNSIELPNSGGKIFAFRTFGGFRITAPDGSDITPHSQKAQGLLAILLTSPDFCRPRSKLQDLLWSDREQEQGAASLRQEISGLNKRFNVFNQVLRADRTMVRLDKSFFEADCDENGPTELAITRNRGFLEGNNVKDPEFTNWLRDRRTEFENEQPTPAKIQHSDDKIAPRTLVLS